MQAEKLIQRMNQHLSCCKPKNVIEAGSLAYCFFRTLVSGSDGLTYFDDYPYLKKLRAYITVNPYGYDYFIGMLSLYYTGERESFMRRVKVHNEILKSLNYYKIFEEGKLKNTLDNSNNPITLQHPNLGINFREIEQIKF